MKRSLTRRTFNRLGVLTGAGAWVLPAWTGASVARVRALDLTPEETELLERFAEVMLPTEGTSLKPRSEVPIVENIARALSLMDEPTLEQVRLGLKLFNYGAVVIGLHFSGFVDLSIEQREAYIHRWENGISMQRGIVDLLKKLTYVGYWQDLGAGRAIGYVGPVSVAGKIPYLGNAPIPAEENPT